MAGELVTRRSVVDCHFLWPDDASCALVFLDELEKGRVETTKDFSFFSSCGRLHATADYFVAPGA